jgi:predicted Rdx family selenoprotein
MLRAAYFGQELLSTFGTTIGEIALIPATGGLFTVTVSYIPQSIGQQGDGKGDKVLPQTVLLWDRKAEGGFPGMFNFRIFLILVNSISFLFLITIYLLLQPV